MVAQCVCPDCCPGSGEDGLAVPGDGQRRLSALARDGETRAVLEVADAIKETSPEAIRRLRARLSA
jgi:hypothetical protein